MSTTLLALEQQIAGDYQHETGKGYASGTCSAAGTTTQITDTSGDSPLDTSDAASLFDGWWLRIDSDSAGTPLNVGELRRVVTGGYTPGNGTLTVSRDFSNATTSTQGYGLYAIPPVTWGTIRGIRSYLNEILPRIYYRYPALLTLVTDGDMETSGVTNWTASNATLTKSTSTGITQGKQALRVLNTSASGYAATANIPVVEGTTYRVVVDVKVASGTAKIIAYDVTNSAEIDTAQTAEIRQGYLYLDNVLIPSGCQNMSIRLSGTEASADAYWDNLSVRRVGATEMAMPSWFTNPGWFEWLQFVGPGYYKEQDNDSYSTDDRAWTNVHNCWVQEDTNGIGYKAQWEGTLVPSTAHLYAICWRPYTELSALTDTTDADPDLVTAFVLANIYADRGDKEKAALWLSRARDLERALPRPRLRPMRVKGI